MRDDDAYNDRLDDIGDWPWHPRWAPWLTPIERRMVAAMVAQIRAGRAPTGLHRRAVSVDDGRRYPTKTQRNASRQLRRYQPSAEAAA